MTTAKTVTIERALRRLRSLNEEIRYRSFFEGKTFTSGVIAFRPGKSADRKQIQHRQSDVVCHVVRGRGRLRVNGRRFPLERGTICHIPRGTPHDFAASPNAELVMLYLLIRTK